MRRDATNWSGVAYGVWLGVLAAYQQFKVPPVLPVLIERYGYDPALAGGLMSVFAVAGLGLGLWLGRAMQRGDASRYLSVGFVCFLVGGAVSLSAPAAGAVVLAGRAIEGVGFVILAICCSVYANFHASQRHLPIVAALVAAWVPAGQIIAALMAAAVLPDGRWTPLWWVGLAATGLTWACTIALARTGHVTLDPRLADRGRAGEGETTAAERRCLWITTGVFALWASQLLAFQTWAPTWFVDVAGFDPTDAALVFLLPVFVFLIANMVAGSILRLGVTLPALLSAALAVQATFWGAVPFLGADLVGGVALVAYGFAVGVTPTCLYAAPGTILGTERAGAVAFGMLQSGRSLGVLAGPMIMALAFMQLGSWSRTAPIFAGVTVLALIGALRLAVDLVGALRDPADSRRVR